MKRNETKSVQIGSLQIGHQNKILIQSMCNIKTSHVQQVAQQINECALLGADLMRVSVLDEEDALAIKKIKELIHVPLIADIHFDYRLAILAVENGADKIRINPGNIGGHENVKAVVETCKKYNVPIRVGVNSGSLRKNNEVYDYKVSASEMIKGCQKLVKELEDLNFYNIVLSLKSSSVLETIEAYRLASQVFPYPLHIGITEAGTKDIGIIRSCAGLAPIIVDGIGDTIRISLSCDPKEEVIACKRLLHDLGLYKNYPTFISCPTCGRTQVDLFPLASRVQKYLETINKPLTVAIMGCIVNGPGEAKQADIGLAGGHNEWALFKKGQVICKLKDNEAFEALKKEIDSY